MALNEEQIIRRNEIFKDIIKKRPVLNGCTYTCDERYDYDRGYYRKLMVPDKKFFGYDAEEIYELFVNESWLFKNIAKELFEKGITQKINRLNERLVQPVSDFARTDGIPGMYSVRTYESECGYVYAQDYKEAVRIADVTYGYLIVGKKNCYGDDLSLIVNFNSTQGLDDLSSMQQNKIDSINVKIMKVKEAMAQSEARIKMLEHHIIAIQMGAITQMGYDEDQE